MPRRALSPRHEEQRSSLLNITAENYFPLARVHDGHWTSFEGVLHSKYPRASIESIARVNGITPDDLARYLYLKSPSHTDHDRSGIIDNLHNAALSGEIHNTLREYELDPKTIKKEKLEGITLNSIPGGSVVQEAIRRKAHELGISADDFARAYAEKYKFDPASNQPPRLDQVDSMTSQDVIDALTPYDMNARPRTPEPESQAEPTRGRRRVVVRPPDGGAGSLGAAGRAARAVDGSGSEVEMTPEEISSMSRNRPRSLGALRARPSSDISQLERIALEREQAAIEAEEQAASVRDAIASRGGYPDPALEEALQATNERKVALEEAARIAAGHVADARAIQTTRIAETRASEAFSRQQAADAAAQASEPPLPAGASATMHNLPPFLGGRTGFAGKNIAALEKELAEPYRPFIGERVAALTPLQRLGQEQAKATLAREKGATTLFGIAAKNIEDTIGQSSYSEIAPMLAEGRSDPSTLAERFMIPYNKQMAMVEEETKRNLKENILPSIYGRFNARHGHRGLYEDRAVRDATEFLARQREAFAEKALERAYGHAEDYSKRNLSAAQLAAQVHTGDLARKADTSRTLHQLGTREQERALQSANIASSIGAQEQAQRQQEINAAMAAHKEQQEYPLRRRAVATAIAHATPVGSDTLNVYREPMVQQPNSMAQLGGLAAALGAAQYANLGRSNNYKGGRIKRAFGGRISPLADLMPSSGGAMSSLDEDPSLQFLMDQAYTQGDNFSPGPIKSGLPPMSTPLDAPPIPEAKNPLSRGAESAKESIRKQREKLSNYADDLGTPGPNPILPWIMKTGLGVAASKNPNVLGAIGEAGLGAFDAYENAQKIEMLKKERAANIHKAIAKSHALEEENRMKRELDAQRLDFDMMHKGREHEEKVRSNKAWEKIQAGKGNATSESTTQVPITIQTENGPEVRHLDLESSKEKRSKEKEQISSEVSFYKKALRHLDKMDQYLEKTGISGVGKDLNNIVATGGGLWGSPKDRGAYEAETNDLVNLASQMQGRTGSRSATALKSLQSAKPNLVSNVREGNQEIHNNKREAFMTDLEIAKFRDKGVSKGLKNYVMTDAISKWEESDPFIIENGKVVGFKYKPEDFLPEEYKVFLGNITSKNDGLADSTDLEQQKSALKKQIAELKAARGR